VVNIGNMMECWSGGRFRSTMHRVHPPIGRERFSIAYFAAPDYDTVIVPLAGLPAADGNANLSRLHAGRAFASFVAGFDGKPR
jgi:isopenicillin N synthase-like dioxygenase